MADDRLETLEQRTRYQPEEVEGRVFARWQDAGIFHPEPEGDAAESFSIAIPPPNVTGSLHMGHALNGSLQDVCIRLARMRGKRTKWIYGTDHAGIATQRQVEKALADEGTDQGGARPRARSSSASGSGASSTARRSPGSCKRLGASLDYEDERFTMDEAYAQGGRARVRAPLREGPDLPRQLHGQLGPGPAHGDLRPRGRAAHASRTAST